jgi:hypothetical protein
MAKRVMIINPPSAERPLRKRLERSYTESLYSFLLTNKHRMVNKILERYAKEVKSNLNLLEELIQLLDVTPFQDLPYRLQKQYEELSRDSMLLSLRAIKEQVSLNEYIDLLNLANDMAVEFAREKSMELVGKKILEDGTIVDNPNAVWRIDEATRDLLKGDLARALEEGWSSRQLAQYWQGSDSVAFSKVRAERIARTEIARADIEAHNEAWRKSGVVRSKVWLISEDPCELCSENYAQGVIDFNDEFENGDPPVHPNCTCDVAGVTEVE